MGRRCTIEWHGTQRIQQLLKNGGFQAFLWTQFLGAFNDNVYQTIVALHVGQRQSGAYVPLVPAVFTLPSCSSPATPATWPTLVSKRSVLIGVKVFEIAVMLFGLAALITGWTEGMLLVLFLMGLHSTIFSPAKYGIVPEMLGDRDLSRANALLEMSTFVAIVLGIAGGGVLFALWKAEPWRIGAGDAGDRRDRLRDQPAHHARAGLGRHAAVPLESLRRDRRQHAPPAARQAAVAGRAGRLLLLVRGRAVQDGPAVLRQRSAARRR